MNTTKEALKERYARLHPLIFKRSLEKAQSYGELFDILDTVPDQFPIVWSEADRRWVTTNLLQTTEGD